METEAWAVFYVKTKQLGEVLEIGADDTWAATAVTLTVQAYFSNCACGFAVGVHDLFVSNIVSNEIKAASYGFYGG